MIEYSRGELSIERANDGSGRLWIYIADAIPGPPGEEEFTSDASVELVAADRQALAGACLRGQPFGFTQEEVAALRVIVEAVLPLTGASALDAYVTRAAAVAAKIAALLPPDR